MTGPGMSCAAWRKSSLSGSSDNCIEIASFEATVAVRDSKNPQGTKLHFSRLEWGRFLRGLKPSQPE